MIPLKFDQALALAYSAANSGQIEEAIRVIGGMPAELLQSDEAIAAMADMHHRSCDVEGAFNLLNQHVGDGHDRSDAFVVKYCDYARDLGKGFVGEGLLKGLIAGGRTGLTRRLAELYLEGRNWAALRALIAKMPADQRDIYLTYLLGRANASLLLEGEVIACADALWAQPEPGPRYAQILLDVWRWRIGDIEASPPICCTENLPAWIASDAKAIAAAPRSPYPSHSVVKSNMGWRALRPRENLPNFLTIGTQRCATTWLWYQFSRCSEVQQLPFKESVYFTDAFDSPFTVDPALADSISPEDLAYWAGPTRNLFRYLRLFGSGLPIRADFSPSYVELPEESVRKIADILGPDVKILFCVRDPVERAWSNLLYDVKLAGIDPTSLSRAERFAHYTSDISIRRSEYAEIYRIWKSYFKKVKVVFYQDIVNVPKLTLREILKFAGVKNVSMQFLQASSQERINTGAEMRMPNEDRSFLFGFHQDRFDAAVRLFGPKAQSWRLNQSHHLD